MFAHYINNRKPCPWGDENLILNANELTRYEKIWLGSEIVSKRASTMELATKCNFGYKSLRKVANKISKNIAVNASNGRPRILDPISCCAMRIKLLEMDNPE